MDENQNRFLRIKFYSKLSSLPYDFNEVGDAKNLYSQQFDAAIGVHLSLIKPGIYVRIGSNLICIVTCCSISKQETRLARINRDTSFKAAFTAHGDLICYRPTDFAEDVAKVIEICNTII